MYGNDGHVLPKAVSETFAPKRTSGMILTHALEYGTHNDQVKYLGSRGGGRGKGKKMIFQFRIKLCNFQILNVMI
jgi:hypothetical protein